MSWSLIPLFAVHDQTNHCELLFWRRYTDTPTTSVTVVERPIDIDFAGPDGVEPFLVLMLMLPYPPKAVRHVGHSNLKLLIAMIT